MMRNGSLLWARCVFLAMLVCGGGGQALARGPLDELKALLRAEPSHDDFVREGEYRNGTYELRTCDIGPSAVPEWTFNATAAARIVLASRSLAYEHALRTLHYPSEITAPLVGAYERQGLEGITRDPSSVFSGDLENSLNETLNRFQATHRNLPLIKFGERRCGGSPALPKATFVVRPAGTRAFLNAVFFGKVCRAKHIDSFNLNECDGWIEILDGASVPVYGRYLYQVVSAGGKVRRGTLLLQSAQVVRLSP